MQLPENAIKIEVPFERECFGCSKTNPHGLKLEYYYHEQTVYTQFQPNHNHSSWGNIVHGGISAAICDESLGWLSMCACQSMTVTKKLTFEYHQPIKIEDKIIVVTSVESIEKNKRLFAVSNIYNQQKQLCVSAKAKMLLVSPKTAKRLNIMPDDAIDQFSKFLDIIHLTNVSFKSS
ncbi:hotdog fold thioesterase [Thiotrichales bacterium 19S3-7]|nr:hotdog fold thioesterase [Thiotrichales bacterium 19S3-7]MCF6800634.1 hotdog fold thioesterase [Thiotrichales bacterium 19S3-11]